MHASAAYGFYMSMHTYICLCVSTKAAHVQVHVRASRLVRIHVYIFKLSEGRTEGVGRQTCSQAGRRAGRPAAGQPGRKAGRRTDRCACVCVCVCAGVCVCVVSALVHLWMFFAPGGVETWGGVVSLRVSLGLSITP